MPQERVNEILRRAEEKGIELPIQMFDFIEVLIQGAEKHGANAWLQPGPPAPTLDHEGMYASINRHSCKACCNIKLDAESGKDNRLHAALRLMMDYTRDELGLK